MSISCAADFAEWYDTEGRAFADEVLKEFVGDNPNFFSVAFAGMISTQIDVGSVFFVDLARLGTGAASGSARGVFEDLLRVLSVVPIGKVTAVGKPLVGRVVQGLAGTFYWRKFSGGLCNPVSIGKALQHTAQRFVVRLEDIAKAMGREISSIEKFGATINDARKALNALKAEVDELAGGLTKSWDDVVNWAEGTDGVVFVGLKRTIRDSAGVRDTFHAILAGRTPQGVRIFDRKGVFKSLDDLSRRYGSKSASEFYNVISNSPVLIIKNWVLAPALANRLNALGPLGAVAVKVAMQIGFNPTVKPETFARAFREHVAKYSPEELYPPPTRPPEMAPLMYTHTVAGPKIEKHDWLSSIAGKWYGDVLLWPILFDFNRGPDFTNQNKMYVGQRVKVPFITDKTPAEIKAYRKRGLDWQ
jgi:hypothetical protein